MTAREAFEAYEAARHRLPEAGPGGACRRVASLTDLAPEVDAYLLDAFGVLNVGETAIPGAVERIAELRRLGKHLRVLTNAASTPQDGLVAKFRRFGFDFQAHEIVSSRMALLQAPRPVGVGLWGMMAAEGMPSSDLEALNARRLTERRADFEQAEGFLLMSSAGWTQTLQDMLEPSLAEHVRPVWVGNPDIVAPREDGFSVEPGAYAHRLADRTGVEPVFFGKPFPSIFELAFAGLPGIAPERMVMVGDSLHTDVLGAQAAGVRSALITGYGFFRDGGAEEGIESSGIRPDFVMTGP